ncbi:MAG: Calx-beta domain-containing protein [Thermoanaerobaculia bacterium]
MLGSAQARAAAIPVAAGAIAEASDGQCSLVEAIENANDDAVTNADCIGGSGPDVIQLATSSTYTFTTATVLDDPTFGNTALPYITSTITLQANGSTIESGNTCTIDATFSATEFRLLLIDSGGNLTIEDATLRNGCADGDTNPGRAGGAILNRGTLTVRRSTLSGNRADNDGGALENLGPALIESSTFSDNSADSGGAVFSDDLVTLRNATLSGNVVTGKGGGVYVSSTTLIVEHVTFSSNTSGFDGDGIYNEFGTIRAKNTLFDGSGCFDFAGFGTWEAEGVNLDSGTSCAGLLGGTPNATLALGALSDYGGPTRTHAPGTGSAAIDAATDCTTFGGVSSITEDQRGEARPFDGDGDGTAQCDAGAVENEIVITSPQTIPVAAGAVVDASDGVCSLVEAIENANDTTTGRLNDDCVAGFPGGGDTIQLAASSTYSSMTAAVLNDPTFGNTALPYITSTITLQANGSTIESGNTCTNDGTLTATEFRLLLIQPGGNLTIEEATLRNGCASGPTSEGQGGAIVNRATLTMRRSTLSANQAQDGGGLLNSGTAVIESSTLSGNSANGGGGAVFAGGSVTLRNATLSGNDASRGGGAFVSATLIVEHVTFSSNTAGGGGIFNLDGTVRAKNTLFGASSCDNVIGTWEGEGVNLDSGTSCAALLGGTANATLALGPLADNGGPTPTHAPGTGSAAIDSAADCTTFGGGSSITEDQRGETRPLDGNGDGTALCDAGAVEIASYAIDDVTLTEDPATATFTISRGTATVGAAAFQVGTAGGTATAGGDYTAVLAQPVTIADGASSVTFGVTVAEDPIYEGAGETFLVDVTGSHVIADGQGIGTILDDDAPPSFSIDDVTAAEGNSGTTSFAFTVTKSGVTGVSGTLDATTSDGTATTADGDYTSLAMPLTFAPAETTKTVTVNVTGDPNFEGDETFNLNLSNAVNATITDALGTGTITNDDAVPSVTLSLTGSPIAEAAAGTVTATLSATSIQDVTVDLAFGGTATLTSDYTRSGTSIVIPAGNASGSITLTAVDDALDEPDETIVVDINGVTNGTEATPQQVTATIADDEGAPALAIGDVAQAEGDSGTTGFVFTVTLTGSTAQIVTVDYATADGTAAAGSDYASTNGTLTFAPAETTKTVTVNVTGDPNFEAGETFSLNLSNPSNAIITDALGTGTITNDDAVPAVTLGLTGSPIAEAAGAATVTATLSPVSSQDVTVDLAFGGTATVTSDYTRSGASIVIPAGSISGSITLSAVDDAVDELDETIVVDIASVTNGTEPAPQQVTATIADDEGAPALAIADVAQAEGDSGTTGFVFTVTLTGSTTQTVTVDYATTDGTATAGSGYASTSGTLTFAPGTTTQTIAVPVTGDPMTETDETFTVTLSGATNATIAGATAIATIENDDPEDADLAVVMTSGSGPFFVTQDVTYEITVTNDGPGIATNVTLTDTLPAGTSFVSATPSQGSCSGTTTVLCNLGTLGVGGSATVTLTLRLDAEGAIENTATVTSDLADAMPANSSASAAIEVAAAAAIPTLSGWLLIMLAGVLLGWGVFRLR